MDVNLFNVTLVNHNGPTNILLPKWNREDAIIYHMIEILDRAGCVKRGNYVWYKNIPKLDAIAKVDYEKCKIPFIELLYTVVFNAHENNQNLSHIFKSLKKFYKKEI